MSKKLHGNDRRNKRIFHLYQIWDSAEEEVFKYGVSAEAISEEDDLSSRVRQQVNLFNRVVGFIRFVGKILKRGIHGRTKADELEKQHIEEFFKAKGHRPRGNPE